MDSYDNFDYLDESSLFEGYDGDELYSDEWDFRTGEDLHEDYEYTFNDMIEQCVGPSSHDAMQEVIHLLAWCFVFRVTTQIIALPQVLCHVISVVTGVTALYSIFSSSVIYVVVLAVLAYMVFILTYHMCRKGCGITLSLTSLMYLVVCEFYLVEASKWHTIRGAQLLVVMKVISLGFDMDSHSQKQFPNPLEYLGYVLCPGAVVFGPWVSFKDYQDIYKLKKWNLSWVVKILWSLVWSFLFLSISSCWAFWAFQGTSWRWLLAYRDALAFRCSHYFVSFLSEAMVACAGFGSTPDGKWKVDVAQPQNVEFPRSLVEVVVCWNKPMHFWLKNCSLYQSFIVYLIFFLTWRAKCSKSILDEFIDVFKTSKPLGNLMAVLSTYMASSLLHGLNFQLAAVLLSLGFYTYVEYNLRSHLAVVFDSCLLARYCKEGKHCRHSHKSNHPMVFLANLGFGALTVFHLAYLGLMFDSSPNLQEEGYSYTHTLSKWASLGFASHWVVFFTYVAYLLV